MLSANTTRFLVYILCFLYGTVIGSFTNAAAMRSVAGKKWWGSERSCCDSCGHILAPHELIPVISFLLQRGRCRKCGRVIPRRHLIAEILCGIVAVMFVVRYGLDVRTLFGMILLPFISFHTWTDIEEQYIYDAWAYAMFVAGLLLRCLGGISGVIDGLLGAVTGFSIIYIVCKASRGGMGFGDALLMLGFGAFFGLKLGLFVLYGAFLIGGVISCVLLLMKKATRKTPLPLGPFFSVSAIICLLYGRQITDFLTIFSPLPWPWL